MLKVAGFDSFLYGSKRNSRQKEEKLTFTEGENTVNDALKKLSDQYGKRFVEYVYDPQGNVRSYLQFFINGQSAAGLNGLETPLVNGDILAIVPPVGGG